jgi:DNA-binding SARP family transcriptional activator
VGDDERVPPATTGANKEGEVEVAVLGPVAVHGAARPFRRSRSLELVVYLSMHPQGASSDAWATALWPERAMASPTLHSTCSAARRSLGRSVAGLDHLPRSRGRLRLAPTVGTDWGRFRALAATDDPASWGSALTLVRGRPFEGLEHADWAVFDGFVSEIEDGVVELALRLAEYHLREGGPRSASRAARAARRALRASPFDERLYRVLLRAADAQGHPGGVESVMGELGRLLSFDLPAPSLRTGVCSEPVDLPDLVHPQTADLYRSLSRHPAARRLQRGRATGGVVTTL